MNAAVVALILSVSPALFCSAVVDVWTAIVVAVGLAALLRFKVKTLWLMIGGAGIELVRYFANGG